MYVCDECDQPVPRGEAVVRGTLHGQSAWHLACWVIRCLRVELAEHVPAQRTEVGGTLTERLRGAG